jgi:hypothetical protein
MPVQLEISDFGSEMQVSSNVKISPAGFSLRRSMMIASARRLLRVAMADFPPSRAAAEADEAVRRKIAADFRDHHDEIRGGSRPDDYSDIRVATSLHSPKPSTPKARI